MTDPFENSLEARLRQFKSEVKTHFNLAKAEIERISSENALLRGKLQELESRDLNVENLAGKRVPYRYQIDIPVPQNTASMLTGTVTVSRDGPFIARRLYVTFRVASVRSGGNADWVGRYLPISSRPEYAWETYWKANAAASIEDVVMPPLDFEWGYSDGGTDRRREDKFIAGDIIARRDEDGVLMVDDIFAAGSMITFTMQPLRAVGGSAPWSDSTGVENFELNAIFDGYKIIQPLQV